MDWPGGTPGEGAGNLQTAQIKLSAMSSTQASVLITSGTLIWGASYGPGSTFTLSTTPFGLDLAQNGRHIWYFCTTAEQEAGQDQQYCGA